MLNPTDWMKKKCGWGIDTYIIRLKCKKSILVGGI